MIEHPEATIDAILAADRATETPPATK